MQISIVIQGSVTLVAQDIVKKFRRILPGSEIIFSTWTEDACLKSISNKYIVNTDPGPYQICEHEVVVRSENINRQIVSTAAGLACSTFPHVLKWRSDFDFNEKKMAEFISRIFLNDLDASVCVLSLNTANPFADIGLVGHLSDWMYLGKREILLQLLENKCLEWTPENYRIPEQRLGKSIFPFGKFTCEQIMVKEGLKVLYGIDLKRFNDQDVRSLFISIVGSRIKIVSPRRIGLITKKYDYLIYPKLSSFRPFVGFYLSTITEIDSSLLSNPLTRSLGVFGLMLKGRLLSVLRGIARWFF
jgi:hypothetical protein